MAKDTPNTPKNEKGGNSPFRKFEQLAKKIARVPKEDALKVRPHQQAKPKTTDRNRS